MKETLTFDDVLIQPAFSNINSRKDVNLNVKIQYPGKFSLSLPIMSSNMDTVTGPEMAQAMNKAGGVGVLHRFWSFEDNVEAYKQSGNKVFCSVGVGDQERFRAQDLYDAGARYFVLDVAHGAQKQVVEQYKWMKEKLLHCFVIVGNFASGQSCGDFWAAMNNGGTPFWSELREKGGKKEWYHEVYGVDGFKVGVGPGSACTTRIKTGVGVPQLSAIMDVAAYFKDHLHKPLIVADGGMKTSGDIAKALAAGADLIMLGGMLAGTHETPGEIINGFEYNGSMKDEHCMIGTGPKSKRYRGSASKESYDDQGKDQSYITAEGEAFEVEYKGPVADVLAGIEGGLRSAMTYVGARNLKEFREKAQFVKITNAGYQESLPHGKKV